MKINFPSSITLAILLLATLIISCKKTEDNRVRFAVLNACNNDTISVNAGGVLLNKLPMEPGTATIYRQLNSESFSYSVLRELANGEIDTARTGTLTFSAKSYSLFVYDSLLVTGANRLKAYLLSDDNFVSPDSLPNTTPVRIVNLNTTTPAVTWLITDTARVDTFFLGEFTGSSAFKMAYLPSNKLYDIRITEGVKGEAVSTLAKFVSGARYDCFQTGNPIGGNIDSFKSDKPTIGVMRRY